MKRKNSKTLALVLRQEHYGVKARRQSFAEGIFADVRRKGDKAAQAAFWQICVRLDPNVHHAATVASKAEAQ